MDEEELYFHYQNNLQYLEEEQEDYKRKWLRFEKRREETCSRSGEDVSHLEVLLNRWREGADSTALYEEFHQCKDEEYGELQKEEDCLQEEHQRIQQKIRDCELQYEKEQREVR